MDSLSLKEEMRRQVAPDLAAIEEALRANLTPYLQIVMDTAGHILNAGGKRLRPLLSVLSARLCGAGGEKIIRLSTIFEFLHAASLLHDDLVDGAGLRRGKPAAHHLFGNEVAVLTGDFLLARTLSTAADMGDPEIIRIIGRVTEEMSQGEIRQLLNKGRLDLTEEEYLDVIRRKTAVLIEGACEVGARAAGAPADQVEALRTFGCNIGIAFQMVDDLLDYTADAGALGKAVGTDLKEGKLTLPVIIALAAATREEKAFMHRLLEAGTFTGEEFAAFVSLLHQYGGISHTRREAARCVDAAKSALSLFSPSLEREILNLTADYALGRKE